MAEAKFYVMKGEVMYGPWNDQESAQSYMQALTAPANLWVLWEVCEDEGAVCGKFIEHWTGGSTS